MATDDGSTSAPLRLPAILQNPKNSALRQVEAHNQQQREKAAARREAAKNKGDDVSVSSSTRGKRVVRRMNNAAFVDNPYAVAPKRADMSPSVPLHPRPLKPSFPPDAIDRAAQIPSVPGTKDPLGASSVNGAFSTSLKGTRALLRKRGRRAESIVPSVENTVRSWLGGEYDIAPGDLGWRVIDKTPVETPARAANANGHAGPSGRRLPAQHQMNALPPLPVEDGAVPAILEVSRSAAHLSWAVPDSFDRLVVHLVARYYELASWSEDQATINGQTVRLTHLVRPNLVKARAPPPSHALLTPETTDVSGPSAGETSSSGTEGEDSDAATEMGQVSDAEEDADRTFTSLTERFGTESDSEDQLTDLGLTHDALMQRFGSMDLHRTVSHGSSAYASSEGGLSEFSLPEANGIAPGWGGSATGSESIGSSPVVPSARLPVPARGGVPQRLGGNADWSDRPTFFEYLFGE